MEFHIKASEYQAKSEQEQTEGLSVLLPIGLREGFVFLIAKTKKLTQDTEALFVYLQEETHRLATSFGSDANAQYRFEQFLGALNEGLSNQIREGRFQIPIEQFHALVGIACETQMFLSGTGDLTALFLHRKPSQTYQIFNLFRGIQTEQSLPTWEKAFAVVLDGELHEGDVFAMSNQNLQHHITADELNSILTTLPPIGAVEKVRQYFPLKTPLLLIVLKMGESKPQTSETKAVLRSDVSVHELNQQEKETRSLLADQSIGLSSLIHTLKTICKKWSQKSRWLKFLTQKKGLTRLLWQLIRHIAWGTYKMLMHLKTKEGRAKTKQVFHSSIRAVLGMQKSTKYLLVGILTIVIILSVSISALSSSRTKAQEQKNYDLQVYKIEDVVERAAGAVIYKDENQARGLYLNASALIDQLPIDTPDRVQKVTDLRNEIQRATDEIRHLVTVPNPALLGDLASLTDGIFGQSFTKIGNDLYVYASDGRVYSLDRTQKVFKPVSVQEPTARVTLAASEDEGHLYALTQDQQIFEFIKDESKLKPIAFSKPEGTLTDLMVYAGRLYTLTVTATDGSVFRSGKTGEGFGTPTRWITSKTTLLADARSFTIDGTVYVLKKNGQIARFISGSESEWNTGVIDPPTTNATDIWTDGESKFLYVIEADTKRLIVFNKENGAFVVQYRSEAFGNLSDVMVDEKAYTIYLLSGSKVYSIAPSHIAR